jgi:hypothetical protein
MTLQVEEKPAGGPRRRTGGTAVKRPGHAAGRRWDAAATAGVSVLIGLTSLMVYWRTLAPSIVWGDSPELTTAAYTAGIPHPTGYPFYMLLAHAFLRFCPFGSAAYRMNLLAALSAALAMGLLYPLMLQVTRARGVSLAATLMFAFSRTF